MIILKDFAAIIKAVLETNWQEDSPAEPTYKFDEYDPKNPNEQILLENYPDRKTWIVENFAKIEHRIKISIYVKPVRYTANTIFDAKENFTNIKTEIDRILTMKKFETVPANNIILGGWNDGETLRVGRGTKGEKGREPIQFISVQFVVAVYYEYYTESS